MTTDKPTIKMWNVIHTAGNRLIGDVEGHHKLGQFPERTTITTSPVMGFVGNTFSTRSGSKYEIQSWAIDSLEAQKIIDEFYEAYPDLKSWGICDKR